LDKLAKDFKTHNKIEKIYYAIVLWKLSRKEWTIKKKLERIENAKDENKVKVSNSGQEAITHYKVLKEHEVKTKEWSVFFSELEVRIETGRMHQIRVHLASIWNPILWDKTYWDKKLNSFFERNFWVKRQLLHSWKIKFFHYGRNKEMCLEARMKEDMERMISGKWES
jgi:23S rRNA-/tRNA-specific pseudouridylate synthase